MEPIQDDVMEEFLKPIVTLNIPVKMASDAPVALYDVQRQYGVQDPIEI